MSYSIPYWFAGGSSSALVWLVLQERSATSTLPFIFIRYKKLLPAASGTVAQGDPQQLVLVQLQQQRAHLIRLELALGASWSKAALPHVAHSITEHRLGKSLEVSHPTTTFMLLRALFGKFWNCVMTEIKKQFQVPVPALDHYVKNVFLHL